jgi:outer membrane protein assembly factor BamB
VAGPAANGGNGIAGIARGADRVWSLIADDNSLFFTVNGHVYRLNRKTGEEVWKYRLDIKLEDMSWFPQEHVKNLDDRFTGTPQMTQLVISEGSVYFGSWDGIHALDAQTGSEKWRLLTPNPIYTSPCVRDGVLYFTCRKGEVGSLMVHPSDIRVKSDMLEALYAVQVEAGTYEGK